MHSYRFEYDLSVSEYIHTLIEFLNGLHPRSDANRLYIPRKEGERGLMSVEDIVSLAKIELKRYVIESNEKLLVAVRGDTENEEMTRRMSLREGADMKERSTGKRK